MKTLKLLFVCFLILGFASMAAYANPDPDNITKDDGTTPAIGGEKEIWVFPVTGPDASAINKANIQWAVNNVLDNGTGIVVLKPFNKVDEPGEQEQFTEFVFETTGANPSAISIKKPMTIRGEYYMGSATAKTLIRGGFGVFSVDTAGAPDAIPSGPVNFNTFESWGAKFFFIFYKAVVGANIEDVDIHDGIIAKFPSTTEPAGDFYGLYMAATVQTDTPPYPPDKITGSINFSDCFFDYSGTVDPQTGYIGNSRGICIIGTNNAYISINECYFNHIGSRCIFVSDTFGELVVNTCTMETTVAHPSTLVERDERNVRAITASGGSLDSGLPDPARGLIVYLSNNTINFDIQEYTDFVLNPILIRLWNVVGGNVRDNHHIYTKSASKKNYGKVIEYVNTSNVETTGNTISGESYVGISIISSNSSLSSYHNTFSHNDMSGLTAEYSQIHLSDTAHDNYFMGVLPNKVGPLVKSPVGQDTARIIIEGHGNIFDSNEYYEPVYPWETGHGIWLLEDTSYGNVIQCPNVLADLKPNKDLWDYYKDKGKDEIDPNVFKPYDCQ